MYIISKEKDYYDGGGCGIDKTIVYVREEKDLTDKYIEHFYFLIKKNNNVRLNHYYPNIKDKYQHISIFVIGFCGKTYVGFKKWYFNETNAKNLFDVCFDITYDLDDVLSLFKRKLDIIELKNVYSELTNMNATGIYHMNKSPIFLIDYIDSVLIKRFNRYSFREGKLKYTINPNLKNYEFYKVLDTYQAFQELSMFIGGVLTNKEKNDIVVSDKTKIETKGFDYKWSFRKEPKKL